MCVGQTITCAKMVNEDAMLISTGKIIEEKVPEFDDAGCRTQITVEVKGSAERMLENWSKDIRHPGTPERCSTASSFTATNPI